MIRLRRSPVSSTNVSCFSQILQLIKSIQLSPRHDVNELFLIFDGNTLVVIYPTTHWTDADREQEEVLEAWTDVIPATWHQQSKWLHQYDCGILFLYSVWAAIQTHFTYDLPIVSMVWYDLITLNLLILINIINTFARILHVC